LSKKTKKHYKMIHFNGKKLLKNKIIIKKNINVKKNAKKSKMNNLLVLQQSKKQQRVEYQKKINFFVDIKKPI